MRVIKLYLTYLLVAGGLLVLCLNGYQLLKARNAESALRKLLQLPSHFPSPVIPLDNPLTVDKITLGRKLFYDTRLSADQQLSCNSCHLQKFAFADSTRFNRGAHGDLLRRNTQALFNLAYLPTYTWSNHFLDKLEAQIAVPLFGFDPVEMGVNDRNRQLVLKRFQGDPAYSLLFVKAFPSLDGEVSYQTIAMALASFLRTLISKDSDYDRYIAGDKSALSDMQKKGLDLFFSDRLGCKGCHTGVNFTVAYTHKNMSSNDREVFVNTGLYNLNGTGSYPDKNQGMYELTLKDEDKGKFRVPSLRNVHFTAPYMHDGSIETLDEVIESYARGGRKVEGGPLEGDGALNPYKSALVRGFDFTAEEKAALIAFLLSLSDQQFVSSPQFQNEQ